MAEVFLKICLAEKLHPFLKPCTKIIKRSLMHHKGEGADVPLFGTTHGTGPKYEL